MVPAWLWMNAHGVSPLPALPAMYWHAHEMFFGFVSAAIAGFLLTAVPSWTGTKGFGGVPLVMLVVCWLAGRLAMVSATVLPFWFVACAELSLLLTLAVLIAPPLVRTRNRNTPLLAVLVALWLLDATFVYALHTGDGLLAARALRVAIDTGLILLTVVAGRIVPTFTANALRKHGENVTVITRSWLERSLIVLMCALALLDLFWMDSQAGAVIAGIAALAHALRLAGWRSLRTRSDSILWVLHVGYVWLPIGLALRALWQLAGFTWAMNWQHAITAGALTTMIVAVMTRVSLGHTGRLLEVSRAITVSYCLLTASVLFRVFAHAIAPSHYLTVLQVAGALWVLAFIVFLVQYLPILIGPRVDGKPG